MLQTRPAVRTRPELHPGAWWLWALLLAATANRTTNPVLLVLTLAVAGFVVISCRRPIDGYRSGFGSFLRLGLTVLAIRTVFYILLGSAGGGHVLFTLPVVPLPAWATGIRLGGPVTADGLLIAVYGALQLATLLCCVGVAAVLTSPRRLLDRLPGALYEVGVAVVVALSLGPELVSSAGRVRRARQLRGDSTTGRSLPAKLRGWARVVLPVLADATDSALALAASMDGRGYGRNRTLPRRERLATGALVLSGLAGLCLGVYGLLDEATPRAITVPALAVGVAGMVAGLALGSRRVHRTHLHQRPWTWRDVVVIAGGAAALGTSIAAEVSGVELNPADVLTVPTLPVLPFIGLLLAATAGWVGRP